MSAADTAYAIGRCAMGRYDRHKGLPGFDMTSQGRLATAKALVVGAGGIGSPLLYYLAAAGVGNIGIVDSDVVELSNLNRQIIHFTGDIGEVKAASAAYKISQLNPEIGIIIHAVRFDDENAAGIVSGYDIVLGAVDNYETRRVLNRACAKTGRPYIDGSVAGYTGMVGFFMPKDGPCRACLVQEEEGKQEGPPPVLGAAAGVVGSIIAAETVRYLAERSNFPSGRVVYFDTRSGVYESFQLAKKDGCPVCGKK